MEGFNKVNKITRIDIADKDCERDTKYECVYSEQMIGNYYFTSYKSRYQYTRIFIRCEDDDVFHELIKLPMQINDENLFVKLNKTQAS